MSKNKCRTCALPAQIRSILENEWAVGKSYPYIAELASEHGHTLPVRTLNDHFLKGHARVTRSAAKAPTQADLSPKASSTMTATGGEISTAPKEDTGEGIKDFDAILREFGFDPAVYAVSPTGIQTSRWQSGDRWLVSYKIRVVLRETVQPLDEIEFDSLRRQIFDKIKDRRPEKPVHGPRQIPVVIPADRQVGKVGKRGGTEELLERCHDQRERLISYLQKINADTVIYGELGDIVEEFNSVASQKFTNDKSLMKQLEIAGSIVESDLQAIHSVIPDITALTVPSNHSAWRNGKDYLGNPEDDWGIFLMKQVEKMFGYNDKYSDVKFIVPEPWEISVAVNAFDYKLGFTHGDKVGNPDKTGDWWKGQAVGDSPLRDISVLNTGHFHTPRVQTIGRDPHGQPVWWLLAPTVDAGSDWFRHIAGHDSDPGLMVYTITEGIGFDIRTLEIL